eukprot:2047237-Amphidinium_carterae.1
MNSQASDVFESFYRGHLGSQQCFCSQPAQLCAVVVAAPDELTTYARHSLEFLARGLVFQGGRT